VDGDAVAGRLGAVVNLLDSREQFFVVVGGVKEAAAV